MGRALLALLLLAAPQSSACQDAGPDRLGAGLWEGRIDEVVRALYENEQFAGAVLVSVNGQVVYKKAVGYADVEKKIPNTPDTKFRIASFTKAFTAMLILQLAEDGILTLDDRLIDHLPDFKKDASGKITIRQLLSHTAGSLLTDMGLIPTLGLNPFKGGRSAM